MVAQFILRITQPHLIQPAQNPKLHDLIHKPIVALTHNLHCDVKSLVVTLTWGVQPFARRGPNFRL